MEAKFDRKTNQLRALLLTLILLLPGVVGAQVQPLNNQETDGYLQWLHSLEQAVKARHDAGIDEGNLLYPFNIPGWSGQEERPYRHLAISKAIMELEHQWLLRGESRESSALVALAHARNYTNLSEFDSAMVWYQAADRLDTLGLFKREIAQERMSVASVVGDSLTMAQLVTNTLGAVDLEGRDQELILVYRWLLTNRDSDALTQLLAKVESQVPDMNDQILFWHAFSQAWLEKRPASLGNLRRLVQSGGLSKDLTEGQRAWVLVAIPDLMFLLGAKEQSRELYEPLTLSGLDQLKTWSTYQLANLDFLNSNFGKAASGFGLVCEAKRLGSWQDHACDLSDLANELDRIRSEGDAYGTAQFYQP